MTKQLCTAAFTNITIVAGQLLMMTHCAAAAAAGADGSDMTSAAGVARTARTIRGSMKLRDALPLVQLPPIAAENARQVLQRLGFRNALDLQLLGGGPEADVLMAALEKEEEGAGLSIGSRAKIRLLVGDGAHLDRVSYAGGCGAAAGAEQDRSSQVTASSAASLPNLMYRTSRLLEERADGSQEGKISGMSSDTIAIVLSVLVGAAGYLVQAYTSQRADRSLAEQAREQHAHELVQQRDHERLTAQIARTERWVDDCCFPAILGLGEYSSARYRFVAAFASNLEANRPEEFAEMYSIETYSMVGLEVEANGAIKTIFNGATIFDPGWIQEHAWSASTWFQSFYNTSSPAVADLGIQDFKELVSRPYIHELPQAFFNFMASDLDGPLAEYYRGYVRYQVKPALERIASILYLHYSAIEAPPNSWVVSTFPGHGSSDSANQIVQYTLGYIRSWDFVLAEWDSGQFDVLFTQNYMLPFMALYKLLAWSRERGERKQQELIGMSSGKLDAGRDATWAVNN
eukprot:SAG31_NODE_2074_length_6511_cov_11.947754_1_plen_517_part_00